MIVLLALLLQQARTTSAEPSYTRAVELLASGDAAGAEAAARQAIEASSRFVPENELEIPPEKKLLFDEAILAARQAYRARRARYFEVLGRALEAQKRYPAARKAFSRANGMEPSSAVALRIASHPDLEAPEKIRTLLAAFFAPDGSAAAATVVPALMATGAFRRPQDLQAFIDVERFRRQAKGVTARVAVLPDFRSVTDFGTLVPSEAYAAGQTLVLYFPASGCNRCGEELDGLGRVLSDVTRAGRKLAAAVLVDERELEATRRILRTLAMRIQVGRRDRLPASWQPPGPSILVVGRRGRTYASVPLEEEPRSAEVRREVAAIFDVLKYVDVPESMTGVQPEIDAVSKRQGERAALFAYLAVARKLEAGPLALGDLGDRIDQLTIESVHNPLPREDLYEMLERVSPLAGVGRTKASLLAALDRDYPKKIFEAVHAKEPAIEREAPREEGVYRVRATPSKREVLLQRSFLEKSTLRHFNLILKDRGDSLEVSWSSEEKESPRGVDATRAGAVFHFGDIPREGVRLVGESGVLWEGAPAHLVEETIVEEALALVDALPGAPFYFRRALSREPAPLERGLAAFRSGKYKDAIREFEAAARTVDPEAPYDEVDLRYNLARAYESAGDRKKAMELLRAIGDVPYQERVDEKLRALETGR